MCDYSLHDVRSRPAKVGDKLITHRSYSFTTGFTAVGDPDVAVCLMPGTELAFEAEEFGIGLYPHIVHQRGEQQRHGHIKCVAFVLAVGSVPRRYSRLRVRGRSRSAGACDAVLVCRQQKI